MKLNETNVGSVDDDVLLLGTVAQAREVPDIVMLDIIKNLTLFTFLA